MKMVYNMLFFLVGIFLSVCGGSKLQETTEKMTYIHDNEDIRPRLYNKKYLKNEDQTWVLAEDSGVWGLIFRELSIEPSKNCRHDYLQIREIVLNKTDRMPPTVRYCNETPPLPYISTHPRLELRFVTDSLWEMHGFWIQAVHASDKDILKAKMERLTKLTTKTLALKSSGKDSSYEASPGVLSDKGPVYYILIGSSAAALLVFGGLLTYYTITVRRHRKRPGASPDVVYVDTEPKTPSRTPSTRSDLPLLEFSQRPACLPLPQTVENIREINLVVDRHVLRKL